MIDAPDIYQYNDYRRFLKDLYLARKKQFTRYSYLKLCAEFGMKKSSYLSMVVAGKRNLSLIAIEQIQKSIKWGSEQKRYFKNLVYYNQARNKKDKTKFHNELEKILGKQRKKLHPDEYAFFSNWFIPVLREMVAFRHFVPNLNWIAKNLIPSVSEALIKKGLDVLERLGHIKKQGKKWVQTEEHMVTDPEVQSDLIHNYHQEMLRLSQQALDLPPENRDISAMTLGVSADQFEWLKKRLLDFRNEIQHEIQDMPQQPTQVSQLNIQLFHTTKPYKKG